MSEKTARATRKTTTPGPVVLTVAERIMVEGLNARQREIQTQLLAPLQQDVAEVSRGIEQRLGLEPGALASTHQIDPSTWTVVSMNGQPAGEA